MKVRLGLVWWSDHKSWFAWPSPGMTVGPVSLFTLKSALLRTMNHIVLWLVLGDFGELRQGISHLVRARKSPFIAKGN